MQMYMHVYILCALFIASESNGGPWQGQLGMEPKNQGERQADEELQCLRETQKEAKGNKRKTTHSEEVYEECCQDVAGESKLTQ